MEDGVHLSSEIYLHEEVCIAFRLGPPPSNTKRTELSARVSSEISLHEELCITFRRASIT